MESASFGHPTEEYKALKKAHFAKKVAEKLRIKERQEVWLTRRATAKQGRPKVKEGASIAEAIITNATAQNLIKA